MNALDTTILSEEGRLLVWCARTSHSGSIQEKIRERVKGGIDWNAFIGSARWHGVVPLVYQSLLASCPEFLPDPVRSGLKQYMGATCILNSVLADELVQLISRLASRGVQVIPFKGPVVSLMAYKSLNLRECDDLDLIVKREAIAEARMILSEMGYEGVHPPSTGESAMGEERLYNVFRKHNGVVRVDLQWTMVHTRFSFTLDRPVMWSRLIPVALPQGTVHSFPPEELLALLCVHGTKHVWELLRWVCDIAELLHAYPSMDWDKVDDLVSDWRCRRSLRLGLFLAQRLFGVDLTEKMQREIIKDADVLRLGMLMPASLLKSPDMGISEQHADAVYLSLKESWTERARFVLVLIHESSPSLATHLPWFRLQAVLIRFHAILRPFLKALVKAADFAGVRNKIARWLTQYE